MTKEDLKNMDAPEKDVGYASPFAVKRNTIMFSICASFFMIVEAIVIIAILIFGIVKLIEKTPLGNLDSSVVLWVSILGGIFISFKLYTLLCRFIIRKFHLQKKLQRDFVTRFKVPFDE